MKKLLAIALSLSMTLALASCASEPAAGSGATSGGGDATKTSITIATGGTTGTYYPMGGAMTTVLGNKLELSSLNVSSTGASKANVFLVTDGEAQMSILQSDVLSYAHSGTDLFAADGIEDSSLWVTGLYNETVQILAAPGIESIEDLRGKTVVVGDVGSGTEFNAAQVLEAYGMTFDDITKNNGSFGDVADGIKDGKIAAGFTVAGAPTTSIVDLATTNEFNMLSLSPEAVKYLTSTYSFLIQENLPAGTYNGIDEEVVCVAVKAALVASDELSEDVVYEFTKAFFENLEELQGSHAKYNLVSAETAVSGASAPIHPGAMKYYKEIGVA